MKDLLLKLLKSVSKGEISVEDGFNQLSDLPYLDADGSNYDTHRPLRNGFSEVIYGEGKNLEQIVGIVNVLNERDINIFITRVDEKKGINLQEGIKGSTYDSVSRTFKLIKRELPALNTDISILCAGTADTPVAEEAFQTAAFYGAEPKRYYDVGVAGLHRLLSRRSEIKNSDVIIVVAGMEGALPSVVGGIFKQPIIAVPTSVGYGTHLNGLTTLMSMLNSCAEGISVVNIDNGFGAACCALRIANLISDKVKSQSTR